MRRGIRPSPPPPAAETAENVEVVSYAMSMLFATSVYTMDPQEQLFVASTSVASAGARFKFFKEDDNIIAWLGKLGTAKGSDNMDE